jgi:diguanylate cyclase (GGDEF)-like protein
MNQTAAKTNDLELRNSTILIIDDNPTSLAVTATYLEESGFIVLVAKDGESGLKQAKYNPPHLILLDVVMPGIDGFETCRRLKHYDTTKDVPVIFMTGLTDTEDKVKGFEVGAVDYVTKPIQRGELLARINTHLRMQALTQQLQRKNLELQQQAFELKVAKEMAECAYIQLQRLAGLDGLTQIANRRRFDEHLSQEWRRMVRDQTPISLILCDIDYFKPFNDYYGHQAGDNCLRQVAQTIDRLVKRPADLAARYGGEEFAVTLPNTGVEGAVQIAELIRFEIEQLKIPHHRSDVSSYVTLSLGISSQVPGYESRSESLIAAADKALYTAKQQGRDRYYLAL